MAFDDFFDEGDFLIDPDDVNSGTGEAWDTGVQPDIFATGEAPDIFTTKDAVVN
jgi:hypothetical protein